MFSKYIVKIASELRVKLKLLIVTLILESLSFGAQETHIPLCTP